MLCCRASFARAGRTGLDRAARSAARRARGGARSYSTLAAAASAHRCGRGALGGVGAACGAAAAPPLTRDGPEDCRDTGSRAPCWGSGSVFPPFGALSMALSPHSTRSSWMLAARAVYPRGDVLVIHSARRYATRLSPFRPRAAPPAPRPRRGIRRSAAHGGPVSARSCGARRVGSLTASDCGSKWLSRTHRQMKENQT